MNDVQVIISMDEYNKLKDNCEKEKKSLRKAQNEFREKFQNFNKELTMVTTYDNGNYGPVKVKWVSKDKVLNQIIELQEKLKKDMEEQFSNMSIRDFIKWKKEIRSKK